MPNQGQVALRMMVSLLNMYPVIKKCMNTTAVSRLQNTLASSASYYVGGGGGKVMLTL